MKERQYDDEPSSPSTDPKVTEAARLGWAEAREYLDNPARFAPRRATPPKRRSNA